MLEAVAVSGRSPAGRGLGHARGLVLDDRPSGGPGRGDLPLARRPATLPLGRGGSAPATTLAVALGMSLGGAQDRQHGQLPRTHRPTGGSAGQGVLHTAQAIPENLILANLGLKAQTTAVQGLVITSPSWVPGLPAPTAREGCGRSIRWNARGLPSSWAAT